MELHLEGWSSKKMGRNRSLACNSVGLGGDSRRVILGTWENQDSELREAEVGHGIGGSLSWELVCEISASSGKDSLAGEEVDYGPGKFNFR